jgi:hypothetical protein
MKKIILALILLISSNLCAKDQILQGEIHRGDYFTAGGEIHVSGKIEGDAYLFGTKVIVDGIVEGDVIATGGTIEIIGSVGGNVRVAGGQVLLSGSIGKNLTAMGGNIQTGAQTRVQGNAFLTGGGLHLEGTFAQNVTVAASDLTLVGKIGGDLRAEVGDLRLLPGAAIGGNLDYSSENPANISSEAKVQGVVTQSSTYKTKIFKKKQILLSAKYLGVLMNFFYCFVVGWITLKFFPTRLDAILRLFRAHPWKTFWVGLLSVFLLPFIFLILFVTIVGFPIAIALLAVSILGFYTAKIFPIFWVTKKFFAHKRYPLAFFAFGLIAFLLISQIPFIGQVLSIVFTLLGLGAMVLRTLTPLKKGDY